jgi:hypothetical protein
VAKRRISPAPACQECGNDSSLVAGSVLHPHLPSLAKKWFWVCDACDARCGCRPGTKRALGVPAGPETRRARQLLHEMRIDPLWRTAIKTVGYTPEDPRARAIITNTARSRVYEYLAWKLGLDKEDCHTALFDVEACRRAWVALAGVDYPLIRAWAKARKEGRDGKERDRSAQGGKGDDAFGGSPPPEHR